MKNHRNDYDEWVTAARGEQPPIIDVTASVLATVRARRPQWVEVPERAPRLAIVVAAAIAALTLLPALQAFWRLADPMTTLVGTLRNAL